MTFNITKPFEKTQMSLPDLTSSHDVAARPVSQNGYDLKLVVSQIFHQIVPTSIYLDHDKMGPYLVSRCQPSSMRCCHCAGSYRWSVIDQLRGTGCQNTMRDRFGRSSSNRN